jgi:hypothetical protein
VTVNRIVLGLVLSVVGAVFLSVPALPPLSRLIYADSLVFAILWLVIPFLIVAPLTGHLFTRQIGRTGLLLTLLPAALYTSAFLVSLPNPGSGSCGGCGAAGVLALLILPTITLAACLVGAVVGLIMFNRARRKLNLRWLGIRILLSQWRRPAELNQSDLSRDPSRGVGV